MAKNSINGGVFLFRFKITWIVTSKLFILQNKSVETGHDLKLPFFDIRQNKNFNPQGKC